MKFYLFKINKANTRLYRAFSKLEKVFLVN